MGVKLPLWIVALVLAPSCHFSSPNVLAQQDPSVGKSPRSSASLSPPQALLKWDRSPQDIISAIQNNIDEARKAYDKIGSLDPDACTFESVFVPLAELDALAASTVLPLAVYESLSPTQELRKAATAAGLLAEKFENETATRTDIFKVQVFAQRNISAPGQLERLLPEERRMAEQWILATKRSGVLILGKQAEGKHLQAQLSFVDNTFLANVDNDEQEIALTEEDLQGVSQAVMSQYTTRNLDDGKIAYEVPFWTTGTISQTADKEQTRQRIYEGHNLRLPNNVVLLDQAVELRRSIAKLLGYKSWAHYVTETLMLKSPENIKKFLDDIEPKLRSVGLKEKKGLLELKRQDYDAQGSDFDGELYLWDYRYYTNTFPCMPLPAILGVFSHVFGLRIEKVEEASTWHPDVKAFAVWEKDAKDSNDFFGYFYLDLSTRNGKQRGWYTYDPAQSYQKSNGDQLYPVAVLVASCSETLRHSDVGEFFRYMGDIFRHILSQTKFVWSQHSGSDDDFFAAPSEMLEQLDLGTHDPGEDIKPPRQP